MSEETPEFVRHVTQMRLEIMFMQEAMGLMLGLADPETRRLVAERLGSVANMQPRNESEELTIAAAKQVIKGTQDGMKYGAKNASTTPR
jgi:hypothetical protein